MKRLNDQFIIGVDHGYGNIKTANHCFKTGILGYDSEPLFTGDMLTYNGRYYLIGEGHKEFIAEKIKDEDYYLLTLVAIAKELKDAELTEANIVLAAGLPLTWTSRQKKEFAAYLGKNKEVDFNYKRVDYHITIDDVRIYPQGYADGERLAILQAEMEERGLRSKRGNAYSVSVLSNLLKNRKYIGEYKYGDVITPDGIPAIIDKELFERVQMRMAANKKAPARAKAEEEYLLTTKLYCGDCGRLMAGESGKGCKGIVYHYYKCSGAKRRLGCKKKAIKKHWIEETVVKLTVSKVLTDEAIDRIADAILVMQEQGDTMTPVLKQQLQQCEAEIRNVMKAIRQGIITETTKEYQEDLETQRDSLKASIQQLQLERWEFNKEEIVEWISKYI